MWRLYLACVLLLAGACTPASPSRTSRALEGETFHSLELGVVGGVGSYGEESEAIPGFAGTYFASGEPCTRVVLLTDTGPSRVAAAREFYDRGQPSCRDEVLVVKKARYRWTQLQEWFFDRLRISDLPGRTTEGINMMRNRIVIGVVDREAGERVERRLAELRIPREAVIIGITGARPVPDDLEFRVGVLDDDYNRVPGVRVEVFRGRECIRTASTDSTGTVRIDSLTPALYTARIVNPPGYTVRTIDPLMRERVAGPGNTDTLRVSPLLTIDLWFRFRLSRSPGAPGGVPTARCGGDS